MRLIALTGGIASGKSTVSARLAEHGAKILDADKLAREVVEPGQPALAQLVETFGDELLLPDGSLNRPALGAIVFSDSAALKKLNDITHPAVWELGQAKLAAIQESDPDAIVIYDVPLLVEASADRPMRFERVVVVDARREERLRRLVEGRGMSEADAVARMGAQASDEARLALADIVIDNDGSRDELLAAVDELWSTLAG
ncbi:dephospho-CoA kinase [Gryllotalpicola reticulitermitis]|uniref:Dephospho-CoA kinase n=1 Tax=Gryllotalpicola reticulitermitis TaxID=1184153 RepID=A0ABV8QCA6_9MICO